MGTTQTIQFETKEGKEYFDKLEQLTLNELMLEWNKSMKLLKEIDERNEGKIVSRPKSSYGHTFR